MTYLNNVPDGGTKFKYQGVTTPALTGLTLVWPAGFTHTHKGRKPISNDKYVVNTWITQKNLFR